MKLARLSRLQRLGETSIFFFLRLLGERSVDVSGQRRGPSSWRAPLLILFPAHLCCHRSAQIYLLGIRILLVFYQEASRWIDSPLKTDQRGAWDVMMASSRSMMDARGHTDKRLVPWKKRGGGVFTPWKVASVIFEHPSISFVRKTWSDIVFQQRVLRNERRGGRSSIVGCRIDRCVMYKW